MFQGKRKGGGQGWGRTGCCGEAREGLGVARVGWAQEQVGQNGVRGEARKTRGPAPPKLPCMCTAGRHQLQQDTRRDLSHTSHLHGMDGSSLLYGGQGWGPRPLPPVPQPRTPGHTPLSRPPATVPSRYRAPSVSTQPYATTSQDHHC